MADIRINALPTTATDFASDDYIAIDGTTNGTRKLNAKTANLTFSDVTLGTSGPSVKSSLSARAPRQGLVFDGTTGGSFTLTSAPSGSWSTDQTSLIPTANPSSAIGFFAIGGTYSTDATYAMYISAGGALVLEQNTAAPSSYRTASVSGFRAAYSGKTVRIATTVSSGTLIIYVNGVSVSYSEGTTGGSPPAWGATLGSATSYFGKLTASQYYFNSELGPLYIYNRALSASEVVALYEAGAPAGADYNNASNTSLITGDNSTFASDTGYWTKSGSVTIGGGNATFSAGGAFLRRDILTGGKRFRLTVVITANTAADGLIIYNGGSNLATYNTTGTKVLEIAASTAASPANSLYLYQAGAGGVTVDTVTLDPLGLLLAPDAAQAGGGLTWYDTSGNAANITLPASGVSWNVPSSRVLGGAWTVQGNLSVNANQVLQTATSDTIYAYNQIRTSLSTGGGLFGVEGNAAGSLITGTNAYATVVSSTSSGTDLQFGTSGVVRATIGKTTGNLLLGTTTDSGNGKLQLATHSSSAGGIGFGTDISLYRASANDLVVGRASHKSLFFYADGTNAGIFTSAGSAGCGFYSNNSTLVFTASGAAALTLDSSQNATFAGKTYTAAGAAATPAISFSGDTDTGFYNAGGNQMALACGGGQIWNTTVNGLSIASGKDIYLGNAYVAGAPTATGYVTIKDSAGNTYKVLVGT